MDSLGMLRIDFCYGGISAVDIGQDEFDAHSSSVLKLDVVDLYALSLPRGAACQQPWLSMTPVVT